MNVPSSAGREPGTPGAVKSVAGRLLQDLRYALRQLRKAPGFTAVAVLTLGLGTGATTTLFSVVHGVLLRALPYPEPDRLVRVFEVGDDGDRPSQMSDPNFADLVEQNRSFEALAQFQTMRVSVTGSREAARVVAAQVSRDFLRALGVQPLLGRAFDPAEQREGAAPAALVSYGYWQRYLESDRDLSRRTLRYGDDVVSVVGVMPPGFDFPEETDLWIPRELEPQSLSRTALNKKVIGRLAAGVTLQGAQEDVSGIARRLKAQLGDDTWMADAAVVPLHEELVGHTRQPLLLLLGASGFLLMIACANVGNLVLARATSHEKELAVFVALGAGRGRLTQQSLTASLLLSLLGGALGVVVAVFGVDLILGIEPGDLPRLGDVRVDATVWLFALVVSVAVAVGLGLLATWRATRRGGRSALTSTHLTEAGSTRLRGLLVVSQVALTLILLLGGGLLLRSFQRLLQVEPGYRTEGAVVLNCYFPYPADEEEAEDQSLFHERLIARLRALPAVSEVGGIDALPLTDRGASGAFLLLNHPDEVTDWESFEAMFEVPGRQGYAQFRRATPGYFRAMQVPLLRGRLFDDRDHPGASHVAVVSRSLAETTWPGRDPIGRLVQFGNMDGDLRPYTVVGVVGDVRDGSLEAEPQPTFYANSRQRAGALTGPYDLVVVTRTDAEAQLAPVRELVHDLDTQLAPNVQTLDDVFADSLTERRFQLLLLGLFGSTALLLAVVGVYGVISLHVAQRTQEIGVRIALGAGRDNVVRLVVRRGLLLAVLGVALGLAGAFAVTHLMQSLLYGVTATDPLTFTAVPLLLLLATLVACFLPAQRAVRIDPAIALRME